MAGSSNDSDMTTIGERCGKATRADGEEGAGSSLGGHTARGLGAVDAGAGSTGDEGVETGDVERVSWRKGASSFSARGAEGCSRSDNKRSGEKHLMVKPDGDAPETSVSMRDVSSHASTRPALILLSCLTSSRRDTIERSTLALPESGGTLDAATKGDGVEDEGSTVLMGVLLGVTVSAVGWATTGFSNFGMDKLCSRLASFVCFSAARFA